MLNCSYFEHTLYIFLLERALFTRHPLFGSRKEHALPFLPFIPRWILFGRNYEEYFEYALKGTPKGVFDQLPQRYRFGGFSDARNGNNGGNEAVEEN